MRRCAPSRQYRCHIQAVSWQPPVPLTSRRRAARRMVEIVRIIGRAVHRIIGLNIATGHWRVGFADNNGTGGFQPRRDHRVRVEIWPLWSGKPASHVSPSTSNKSFIVIGTPCSGPDIAFGDCVICRFGSLRAASKRVAITALIAGLCFSIRSMKCCVASFEETLPAAIFRPVRAPVIYAVSFHPSLWTRRSALGKLAPVKNVPSRTIGRKTCSVKCKTCHY